MRVYIAAPFFNEEQLSKVKGIESLLEDAGVEFFSPRSEGSLGNMTPEERKAKMSDIFQSNVDHMDWCTHMVAVIDDRDTGTIWEMGYGFATGKGIVTYSACYHGINVMLNESIMYHANELQDIMGGLNGELTSEKTTEVH